tara:strand:- start:24 stop:548 length:525 start_codon:yes stop_codon:yes gene_type:complete
MKIKKLIKILECIEGDYEGKLPKDMYELGTYRGSKGQISIDDMDFVHVMRAFIKSISYDEGLQHSVSQTNQIMKLEQKVSQLLSREKYLKERVEELTPKKATPKYDFSEVPNDCEGQEFVDNVKKYLNTGKYKMRVRGQHLDKAKLINGQTWKNYTYGQPIDMSTHLRVYIEEK